MTRADFEALYSNTIARFYDYVADPRDADTASVLAPLLDTVIVTLKKRRGYLLPVGSDSETVFRERDVWTFAVFTASLVTTVATPLRFAVAKAVLPRHGFAWLYRHPALFLEWKQYLEGRSTKTIFNTLIDGEPATTAHVSPKQNDVNTSDDAVPSEKTDDTEKKEKTKTPSAALRTATQTLNTNNKITPAKTQAVIKEIDLNAIQHVVEPATASPVAASVPKKEGAPEKVTASLPPLHARDFWRWLATRVTQHDITPNQPDSIVHGVEHGVLVCFPDAIDQFLVWHAQRAGLNDITAMALEERIALTKAIKKRKDLVRTASNSRVHPYYYGKWEERRQLSGVVIAQAVLFGDHKSIEINPALTLDPVVTA